MGKRPWSALRQTVQLESKIDKCESLATTMKNMASEAEKLAGEMKAGAFEMEKLAGDFRSEVTRQSGASRAPVPVTGHTAPWPSHF